MPISSTTTSKPILSSQLQGAQNMDLATLQNILSSPSAGLQPIQQASSDAINRAYSAMPQTATNALAARGFGASGKVGDAVYDTEGSRLGAQSNLYGQMAQLGSQRQLSAADIINAMIGTGKGTQTTQTQSPLATVSQSLGSLGTLLTMGSDSFNGSILGKILGTGSSGPTAGTLNPSSGVFSNGGGLDQDGNSSASLAFPFGGSGYGG